MTTSVIRRTPHAATSSASSSGAQGLVVLGNHRHVIDSRRLIVIVGAAAAWARRAFAEPEGRDERLGHLGRVGCALCLLGSEIIVLHAPDDKEIATMGDFLNYALKPGTRSRTARVIHPDRL